MGKQYSITRDTSPAVIGSGMRQIIRVHTSNQIRNNFCREMALSLPVSGY